MLIRKVINKILGFCVSELKPILTKEVKLDSFPNIKVKTVQSVLTNIVEPFRLIDVKIGKGTYIATSSKISRTEIGKFCSIGPNLLCGWGIHPTNGLSTSPYFYSTQNQNSDSLATKDQRSELNEIQWWNFNDDELKDVNKYFF